MGQCEDSELGIRSPESSLVFAPPLSHQKNGRIVSSSKLALWRNKSHLPSLSFPSVLPTPFPVPSLRIRIAKWSPFRRGNAQQPTLATPCLSRWTGSCITCGSPMRPFGTSWRGSRLRCRGAWERTPTPQPP